MNGKPIAASLSLNVEKDDVDVAWHELFHPSTTDSSASVIDWFTSMYHPTDIRLTGSGRGALAMILASFGITTGDEVVVQAYTCMVVINAIRSVGATPIFCDIDKTLNIDPAFLQSVITKKTKAVIVQHTFGVPADIFSIQKILEKWTNIALIEDCAHSIGSQYAEMPVGSYGDAAFFSFGRDKAFSSVWGGMALINASGKKYQKQPLSSYPLIDPPMSWVRTQILHPLLFSLFLPVYRYGIGKVGIELAKQLHLISNQVERSEKDGIPAEVARYLYAPSLARLLMTQLQKLDRYVKERRSDVDQYVRCFTKNDGYTTQEIRAGSSLMRFTIFVDMADDLIVYAKKHGVLLGRWYSHVIDPGGSSYEKAGYQDGSCPNAEWYAKRAVNLPTRISARERDIVIRTIKSWKGNT